jgi:L-seryl-tRNA(Ser) seleniumtransferase
LASSDKLTTLEPSDSAAAQASDIPSVDRLLNEPELAQSLTRCGRTVVVAETREELQHLRERALRGELRLADLQPQAIARGIESRLASRALPRLRSVFNLTGTVLHTNFGRALLPDAAVQAVIRAMRTPVSLEFDLDSGGRGDRDSIVEALLCELTGAAAATVVNNNAAAVLLALNSLADGGEVVVSRGELVEIGGSFRVPDVMAKSGAILREVGTTNRTRTVDYERAITERTRLLLRVHRSNFEITGFTEQASTAELVALARKRGIPLMEDLGSGALFDLRAIGVSGEPGVLDSLRSGVDIVTYSGDKLLGGPQAGLISGGSELIARMRANSLFRALRVDKLIYAALEATLLAYVKKDHDAVPTLRMMRLTKEAIGERAEALAARVPAPKLKVEVVNGESILGGGAAPSSVLPTRLLAMTCEGLSADELAALLRRSEPPIIARVEEGRVLLDLRTVLPGEDAQVAAALNRIVA